VNVVLDVLREEARSFGAAFLVLLVVLVLASSGIYLFEHQAQPEAFGSIPAAMWWAVATLTTVGYGDVTPITVGGKIFGAFITVVGIGMVALPAGILASGFSEHLHERRAAFGEKVDKALKNGIISDREESELERTRKELGLTHEEAAAILEQTRKHRQADQQTCPHCGRSMKGN
jgi:voltage-gated potassium channel